MWKNNSGISLITLVVTIIVMLILVSISLFDGLNTPEQATLARFISEFSDFNLAIANDYASRAKEYALEGENITTEQIYYMIASGKTIGEEEPTQSAGLVAELGYDIVPANLEGTEYYEITDDINVANWKSQKIYYQSDEKHYVTDMGEAFVLPGYLVIEEGESRRWINASKYYIEN